MPQKSNTPADERSTVPQEPDDELEMADDDEDFEDDEDMDDESEIEEDEAEKE
jgi:hypothetical protein